MNVHFMCAYYSQYAHKNLAPRTQKQWDAFKFTRAVKSGLINGYMTVPWKNKPHEEIDTKNVHRAREIFGSFVRGRISHLGIEDPSIIPVPSKDGLVRAETYRSAEMVREAMAGSDLEANVECILRFSKEMERAAAGGTRDRTALAEGMVLISRPRSRAVILVDDVITTGGSLLAAYDVLSAAAYPPTCAICCAHTVSDNLTAAFGHHEREYDPDAGEF